MALLWAKILVIVQFVLEIYGTDIDGRVSVAELNNRLSASLTKIEDQVLANEEFYTYLRQEETNYGYTAEEIKNNHVANEESLKKLHLISGVNRAQEPIPTFSAFASDSLDYNDAERIHYDSVITNIGGSYDNTTYRFTCSLRGYYMFSFAIYSDFRGIAATILRDGYRMCTAYAYGSSEPGATDDLDQGSNSCIMFCEAGQIVWVEAIYDGFLIGGVNRHSTFSGFMIEAL